MQEEVNTPLALLSKPYFKHSLLFCKRLMVEEHYTLHYIYIYM